MLEDRALLAPLVASGPPVLVSATGVTLSATVNPNGAAASATFQYSTDPTFTPTVAQTIGSGFSLPSGVAVDAAGDVFIANQGNNAVEEVMVGGTIKTIGAGFKAPGGVAMDGAGDVLVADSGNNAVKEVLPDGTINTIGSGFSGAGGVAVDVAGDVFVADSSNNALKEVLPGGSINTVGPGFDFPEGAAVDAAGDVFVADHGDNTVKEVLPDGTLKTIGAGFSAPSGVAVDAAGDVFVADSGNNAVKEVLPRGTIKTIGSGFSAPSGVAVDAAGDVFVADSGNNRVVELSPPAVAAAPAPLGGSVATAVSGAVTGLSSGTTYYFRVVAAAAGGTVADTQSPPESFTTLTPPTVSTQPALSVSATGATLAATVDPNGSSVIAAFQYSSDPKFAPTVIHTVGSGFSDPGGVAVDSAGDVFVADSGNKRVNEVLPGGTISTIGSGFSAPEGVAVNAAGVVFVADSGNNTVEEVLPGGTIATIDSGFSNPSGVAVDAAGDVFVADTGNNQVVELSLPAAAATTSPVSGSTAMAVMGTLVGLTSGTTYYYRAVASGTGGTVAVTQSPPASFTTPMPPTVTSEAVVSVSATGASLTAMVNPNGAPVTATFQYSTDPTFTPTDLYERFISAAYSHSGGLAVDATGDVFDSGVEILPGGTLSAINDLGDISGLTSVAVDPAGDVIVAGGDSVEEVLNGSVVRTIGSGFNNPGGVAVDAAGNVFVSDTGNNVIKEILPDGTIKTIGSGFNSPGAVAVDAAGDVFVADFGNEAVKEVLPDGTIETIGPGIFALGVAVDRTGDVFIGVVGGVVEEIPLGGPLTGITYTGDTHTFLTALTADALGDVIYGVGGAFGDAIVELLPPTAAATPSVSGSAATMVSGTLTGLNPGTTYYYRAVASGPGGIVGDTQSPPRSFTTAAVPPTLLFPFVADVTSTTATLGGSLYAKGEESGPKRGVLYAPVAADTNPTLGGPGVTEVDSASTAIGMFSDNVTGLSPGTVYAFVAFATNSAGTVYTQVSTFQTPGMPTPTSRPEPPQLVGAVGVSQSRKETSYTLTFAAPLNAAAAGNPALYRVLEGVTKVVRRHKTTVYTKALKIKSVVYNAASHSVTIALAKPYKRAVELTIEPGLEGADGVSSGAGITRIISRAAGMPGQ